VGGRDQPAAGIGDHRRAAIRYDGDPSSLGEPMEQDRHLLLQIARSVARQCGFNAVAGQERTGRRRIFGGDEIDFAQEPQGAKGDVVGVSDRHGYHVEHA
jgi:hypothetical protein